MKLYSKEKYYSNIYKNNPNNCKDKIIIQNFFINKNYSNFY